MYSYTNLKMLSTALPVILALLLPFPAAVYASDAKVWSESTGASPESSGITFEETEFETKFKIESNGVTYWFTEDELLQAKAFAQSFVEQIDKSICLKEGSRGKKASTPLSEPELQNLAQTLAGVVLVTAEVPNSADKRNVYPLLSRTPPEKPLSGVAFADDNDEVYLGFPQFVLGSGGIKKVYVGAKRSAILAPQRSGFELASPFQDFTSWRACYFIPTPKENVKAHEAQLQKEFEIQNQFAESTGIAKLHTIKKCKISTYLIGDYFSDGDIRNLKTKFGNKISEEMFLRLMNHVYAQEALFHRKRIPHCDMKPGNILSHNNGQTFKITDFGNAAYGGQKTGTGATPAYLPPEFVLSEPDQTPRPIFTSVLNRLRKLDVYSTTLSMYQIFGLTEGKGCKGTNSEVYLALSKVRTITESEGNDAGLDALCKYCGINCDGNTGKFKTPVTAIEKLLVRGIAPDPKFRIEAAEFQRQVELIQTQHLLKTQFGMPASADLVTSERANSLTSVRMRNMPAGNYFFFIYPNGEMVASETPLTYENGKPLLTGIFSLAGPPDHRAIWFRSENLAQEDIENKHPFETQLDVAPNVAIDAFMKDLFQVRFSVSDAKRLPDYTADIPAK